MRRERLGTHSLDHSRGDALFHQNPIGPLAGGGNGGSSVCPACVRSRSIKRGVWLSNLGIPPAHDMCRQAHACHRAHTHWADTEAGRDRTGHPSYRQRPANTQGCNTGCKCIAAGVAAACSDTCSTAQTSPMPQWTMPCSRLHIIQIPGLQASVGPARRLHTGNMPNRTDFTGHINRPHPVQRACPE